MAAELLFAAPGVSVAPPPGSPYGRAIAVPPLQLRPTESAASDGSEHGAATDDPAEAAAAEYGAAPSPGGTTDDAPHRSLPGVTALDPGLPGEGTPRGGASTTRKARVPGVAGGSASAAGLQVRVAPSTARPHHVEPLSPPAIGDSGTVESFTARTDSGYFGSSVGADLSPGAAAAARQYKRRSKATAQKDRVAQLKNMSQELTAAEAGRGQLVRTVHTTIQQRQRQRFASQMHLLKLQLNMKLPVPSNVDGDENGAKAILDKYSRNRGGRVEPESSSDDEAADEERLNAHIPNATLASDVKRRLLEEVVPSQYQVRLFHKCALTGRPPPSVQEALDQRSVPRIEHMPASGSHVARSGTGSSMSTISGRSRRGDGVQSAPSSSSKPASFKAVTDANRPTPPPQPLLPKPPSRNQLQRSGSSASQQHPALPERHASRRSMGSNGSAVFMTENDAELAAHRRSLELDDAALRLKQLRETKREPADFAKLRSHDRHAQQFRRSHWDKQIAEAEKKRLERSTRRKSQRSGSASPQKRGGGGGAHEASVMMAGSSGEAQQHDDAADSPSAEGAPKKKKNPLTDRPAQHTTDSIEQFLAALRHDTERFNKQQLDELQRSRTAQGTFHATKERAFEALLASGALRNAPANKVLLTLRKRVKGAAKAKDQAERLDVFYQHIDRVADCIPLLFHTPAETVTARKFLDAVRENVTTRDGQQNEADMQSCVFAVYPTERLLQDAVVSLLELAAPMFNVTEAAFKQWITVQLQCFSDRDREYQQKFRKVEQQFGRDSATEAKFKLTIHTVRGFSHFSQLRPQLSVQVVAERKTVNTPALQGIKPLWHEAFVLHLQNDGNPVKLYVIMNDGEVIGSGTLSVSKAPIGKAVKQWVSVQGTQANAGEMQVTLEVYPPVMFQRPA